MIDDKKAFLQAKTKNIEHTLMILQRSYLGLEEMISEVKELIDEVVYDLVTIRKELDD